ncbi:hypothetical protein BC827DRAFT_1133986, partial [Russula dissimulans]
GFEGGLPFVAFLDSEVVVSPSHVKFGKIACTFVMDHLDLQDMSLAAGPRTPLGRPHDDEETPTLTRRQGGPVDQERIGLKVLMMSPRDSERRGPPPAIPRQRQAKTRGDPSMDSSRPQGGTT